MLPQSYELPAAILIMLGGAVACFAGYRLFRIVLVIYGFIFGAFGASSLMGITNTIGMIVAWLVGGLVGALIMTFAYFVGIALIGAGVGALVAQVAWDQMRSVDPPAVAVIAFSIVGAVGAMLLQRYVIVIATAFGGAWTILVGGLAIAGGGGRVRAAATGNVWILYPFAPLQGQRWIPIAWLVLGLIGTGVQLGLTGRKKR